MVDQFLETEAETLDSAREQLNEQIKNKSVNNNAVILDETIISRGGTDTVRATGDSYKTALLSARCNVPIGVTILEEKEAIPSSRSSIEIEAPDETAAKRYAINNKTASVEGISIKRNGSNGIFGIGKKSPLYQVDIYQPSVAEIKFQSKAKIRVELGEMPSYGYCQKCGRQNSPIRPSGNYFCSTSCEEVYYKAAIAKALSGSFVINATGQDISNTLYSMKRTAESTTYCWSCGANINLAHEKCPKCKKNQKFKKGV